MTLTNQTTSVVNRLGKSKLEDLGLQTTLHEIFNAERENVIKLHLVLGKYSNANKATKQGISFEKSALVLLIESEQLTGSLTDLGQGILDSPYLALATEAELSDKFQLLKF